MAGLSLAQILDFFFGAFENLADSRDLLGVFGAPGGGSHRRLHHARGRPGDQSAGGAHPRRPIAPGLSAIPDLLNSVGGLLELISAGIGETISAATLSLFRRDQSLIFKLLESGIRRTGAGTV